LTVRIRAKRVAQKRHRSLAALPDQLGIAHLGITPTHVSGLNTTEAQISEKRLSQPLAIERDWQCAHLKPRQCLFLFCV
jgi:hypothetical protein